MNAAFKRVAQRIVAELGCRTRAPKGAINRVQRYILSRVNLPPVLLGTSSFTATGWEGTFYPKGMRSADYLASYADHFHTVEVDSTFYACPTPRTVSNWAARTPENFVFSVKVPQAVTHEKVLVDCDAELAEFFGTMDLRGAKLGLQFPAFDRWKFPTQKHFLELLAPFLMKLPRDRKYAVEIRNKNWIPMKSSEPNENKKKYQKEYFRVTITYTDGEFSGRVFKERAKAEKYALRQRKSPVVKNTKIEPFTRNQYEWHRSRMMPQDTTDTSKN